MDGAWDAVRFDNQTTGEVRDSWISNARDDGIEADVGASLVVDNVLFDNCFVGVSSTPANNMTSTRTITLRNVLMSLGNYNYKGTTMPGAFFKYTGNSPSTEVHDSVFAFSRDSFINNDRVRYAWEKMTSCSNNLLLWTSDAPFPSNFPRPPSCFQVIEGAEARRIWDERRAGFIANW